MRLRRDNTDDPRVAHDLDVLATSYGESMPVPPADDASPPRKGWRRDNAGDARVMSDVESLAAAYGDGPPPPLPPVDDDPTRDPFVRGFLRAAQHLRGHRGYYAAFAAWLLLMFVVVPATQHHPSTTSRPDELASDASAVAATEPSSTTTSTTTADVVAAPAYDAPTFSPIVATAAPDTTTTTASAAPAPVAEVAAPSRLVIARSGYASTTGGTPLEQDPGDGQLPVASAGGQDSKRSFVQLSGGGTVLHLALGSGSVNDGAAAISACAIDAPGWKSDRAQPMPGPAYGKPCVAGTRLDDGSWVFDLSSFGSPSSRAGFALTPTPGAAVGAFQVVFSATTLPPPAS